MRVLLIEGGFVVGEIYGVRVADVAENNPALLCVEDSGYSAALGKSYSAGVLSGEATQIPAPSPAVPASVSPRQIRQALTAATLRTAVEAAVAAGDQDLKDWYEFSTEFLRHSPVVIAMAAAIEVSDAQLDELWTLAYSL